MSAVGLNISGTCKALLKGSYICPIAYPNEYRQLENEETRLVVEEWLDVIQMRLARLGEGGAYFMAAQVPHERMVDQVRREFAQFRDVYGPVLAVLDSIRRAGGESQSISMGGLVDLSSLESGLNRNPQIATDLQASVKHGSATADHRDLLERAAKLLVDEGYLIETDGKANRYRFTGKVARVEQALDFLQHHAPDVFKRIDEQELEQGRQSADLFSEASGV